MRVGILVFPGSNCDRDVHHVIQDIGMEPVYVWHEDFIPSDTDAIILPGGFSYGDRLRAGAIASHSPVIKSVRKMAKEGKPILGICNGFQILTEARLLPGVLLPNDTGKFMCGWTRIIHGGRKTPFTLKMPAGSDVHIPVANGEGRYYADKNTIHDMEKHDQILFRYATDVNGSTDRIAGVCNKQGNVVGIMPHPERAAELETNPYDHRPARSIFESLEGM